MAYPLSLQSVPENLRHLVRQPGWWAAVASVGVHLLILVPITLTRSDVAEPDVQSPVALLELTPEEQSRIPDFSVPDLAFPDPLDNSYQLDPLPQSPPPQDFSAGLPPFFMPPVPPPSVFSAQPPPFLRSQPPLPRQTTPPAPPTPVPPVSAAPASPPPATGGFSGDTQDLAELNDLAAADPEAQPQTPIETAEERLERLRQLYSYNPEGTGEEQSVQTLNTWIEDYNEQLGPLLADYKQLNLAGPYPRAACLRQMQGTAVIGALIDTDGKVLEEPAPKVLQSSGYGIFNQRALDAVKAYTFDEADNRQLYLVSVTFAPNSDICAAMGTPEATDP